MNRRELDVLLTAIARKHLQLDTLQTRYSDRLDFHDCAVWVIRDALQAAFDAGVAHGRSLVSPSN
ncbi:DUF6900 domain-containing protein [Burkholderia ubonensis]|uniref:DUF6900 domain-containing protein n=1 Tax=Burkholderia ubonensis TaxID=101571 RepID=UPI0007549EB5|nr:hypothetical protein [Burkholderia ubonensis]KWN80917.1 hypothetical protein WM23_20345 [Burkholderia ubonensis]